MLVLSRKEGEEIVIGDNIKIVISRIDGNRVSVGIEAPKDVKIIRSELSGTEPEAQKKRRASHLVGAVSMQSQRCRSSFNSNAK